MNAGSRSGRRPFAVLILALSVAGSHARAQVSPPGAYPGPLARPVVPPSYAGHAHAQYPAVPPPNAFGPQLGLRRVQAQPSDLAPPAPTAPGMGESAAPSGPFGAVPPSNTTDLSLPAAEREFTGGEPTEAAAEGEAAEEPDETKWLMRTLGLEDSPFQVYGWIQNSFTGNPSFPSDRINFGVTPNYRSNDWLGNQYYTVFEKALKHDDRIDVGARLDFLFGHDWEFNKMRGVFDNAFRSGQFAGIDLAQFYGEMHLPVLTDGGLDVKFGRWYTLHGYEVVPAIARPLLSVPYMFNFGQPFTHWGVMTTWNVNDRLVVYNGSPQGWDRFQNQNAPWGYMGGFSWTSKDEKLNLTHIYSVNSHVYPRQYLAAQAGSPPLLVANSQFTDGNLNLWTTVLSYKWTDKLTQVIETDQAIENGVPLFTPSGQRLQTKGEWYSFGNWFLYQFNDQLTGVWRSEIFRDDDGVRTGLATNYSEMTLGLIYKPCPNLWVRPEARYDWVRSGNPYNGGVSDSQFTMAFDVILLY